MNALRGGARSFACLARQGNLPPFLRRPRFPCTFRVRAATFVTPLRGNGCALLGRGACLTRKRNRAALLRCLALKSEKHAALADRREALLRCGTILFPSCFAVLFRARGFPVLGGFPRGAGVRNCAALFGVLPSQRAKAAARRACAPIRLCCFFTIALRCSAVMVAIRFLAMALRSSGVFFAALAFIIALRCSNVPHGFEGPLSPPGVPFVNFAPCALKCAIQRISASFQA